MIFGFGLALLVALGASACGGDGGKDVAKSAPPTTTAPQTSAAAAPSAAADDDDKVVYHDALVGNDVTVKKFPTIIGAMPAKLTCKDLLKGGKILGNTYPNGEDFYLQLCKQVPRK
jgi:hypothetical protein